MKVALSKHFQLQAEDGFLVSAVYSFSHDLGDSEPITVEMQHCAATSVVKYLSIVRANDESPGDFKIMEGGVFDRTDGYGAIELHNFCRLAVYLKWRITSWLCVLKLRAAIYFTDIEYGSFQFHLYIVPDFSPLLREIEAKLAERSLKYMCGPVSRFKFKENVSKICLDMPNEHVCGWNVELLNGDQKDLCDIAKLHYNEDMIPFQVTASWPETEDRPPQRLIHKLSIVGASDDFSLTVMSPTQCTNRHTTHTGKLDIDKDVLTAKCVLKNLNHHQLRDLFR